MANASWDPYSVPQIDENVKIPEEISNRIHFHLFEAHYKALTKIWISHLFIDNKTIGCNHICILVTIESLSRNPARFLNVALRLMM